MIEHQIRIQSADGVKTTRNQKALIEKGFRMGVDYLSQCNAIGHKIDMLVHTLDRRVMGEVGGVYMGHEKERHHFIMPTGRGAQTMSNAQVHETIHAAHFDIGIPDCGRVENRVNRLLSRPKEFFGKANTEPVGCFTLVAEMAALYGERAWIMHAIKNSLDVNVPALKGRLRELQGYGSPGVMAIDWRDVHFPDYYPLAMNMADRIKGSFFKHWTAKNTIAKLLRTNIEYYMHSNTSDGPQLRDLFLNPGKTLLNDSRTIAEAYPAGVVFSREEKSPTNTCII